MIAVGILLSLFYISSLESLNKYGKYYDFMDWMASKHINEEGVKIISFDIKDYLTTNSLVAVPLIFGIGVVLVSIGNKIK